MERLREYARLLVEIGVNVQKGQTLVIASPVDCAPFARLCATAAYGLGCREVVMRWSDDYLTREKYLRADGAIFDSTPRWNQEFLNGYAREGAAYLAISAADPENLKGVDPDRLVRSQQAGGRDLKEFYRLQMSGGFPWCIASVPIPSWARRVFPGLSDGAAVERLWDAIYAAMRITGDGRAVERWRDHIAMLAERKRKLNALHLASLHYTNRLGTDLVVRLPEGCLWEAGDDRT